MMTFTLAATPPIVLIDATVNLKATFLDDAGNPVSGLEVTFYKYQGGVSTNIGANTTNASGIAEINPAMTGYANEYISFVTTTIYGGSVRQSSQASIYLKGEDPRETLKNLLEPIKLYDDGYTTEANVTVQEAFDPSMFEDSDFVLWVELAEDADHQVDGSGDRRITTKWNIGMTGQTHGNFTVNRMLWDAEQAVKRVLGNAFNTPGGILKHIFTVGMQPRIVDRTAKRAIVTQKYQIVTERIVHKEGG